MSQLKGRNLKPSHWKAAKYGITAKEGLSGVFSGFGTKGSKTRCVEASPGTSWKPLNPMDFYRFPRGEREEEAGPHLKFLRLKRIAWESPHLLNKSIVMFAQRYGLLGVFWSIFLTKPAVPRGKLLVAPEAVLEDSGALRRVDPATEGATLLLAAQEEHGLFEESLGTLPREARLSAIAQPEEVRFIAAGKPGQSRKIVPWQKIRQGFGSLFVMSNAGVSVLCSREPLSWWRVLLDSFLTPEDVLSSHHAQLSGVRTIFGPDGNGFLRQGWICDSLFFAMQLMVCLDYSEESTIRRCESRGCPNYFRAGPYSRARYCSPQCASRASTRMARGQEP